MTSFGAQRVVPGRRKPGLQARQENEARHGSTAKPLPVIRARLVAAVSALKSERRWAIARNIS